MYVIIANDTLVFNGFRNDSSPYFSQISKSVQCFIFSNRTDAEKSADEVFDCIETPMTIKVVSVESLL